jgi:hypothetical protein
VRGNFRKRGERWYYWAELDPGPDGKRRQVSRGGFRTRREAEHAFAELRDEVRRGKYVSPSKITVAAYLQGEWLPAVKASIRAGTWDHYANMVDAYVVPRIGARKLAEVLPTQLNALYAELLVDGRRHGGASPHAPFATCTPCCTRRSATPCAGASSPAARRTAANRHGPGGPR